MPPDTCCQVRKDARQPRQQLGRTAAQLLPEEAMDTRDHQHRQVIFQPELEVRRSSQAPVPARRRVGPKTAPAAW